MTTHPRVPADVEPDSIIDLVEDCREVSGVLSPYLPPSVIDLVGRLPKARPVLDVEMGAPVAAGMDGWGEYGS